jgi:hypothetical protein
MVQLCDHNGEYFIKCAISRKCLQSWGVGLGCKTSIGEYLYNVYSLITKPMDLAI